MTVPDRLKALTDKNQNQVTGIDFVYVETIGQVTLDVYFLRPPETLADPLLKLNPNPPGPGTLTADPKLTSDKIKISSTWEEGNLAEITVTNIEGVWVDSRPVLRLTTERPGGFSKYTLSIDDPRIDRYFNNVEFSFKAGCESDLDCKPLPHECPTEDAIDFPVDYQARDFWSFRRALLDFAAQRYPDWQDRWEADVGIMLVEVMSALGDELAYYQDRIAWEAYLETATQRRSLRRHARLVDYTIHDGLGATTWLDVTVSPSATGKGAIPAGSDVWAISDDGTQINFEVGRGLADTLNKITSPVDAKRNEFKPHLWDKDDTCLKVGSTELFIEEHHESNLGKGQWVLLKTEPQTKAIVARRWIVRLIEIKNTKDPVFQKDITRLQWEIDQALPFEMDLTILTVRGNLVPITAGKKEKKRFAIGSTDDPINRPTAVERQGPNASIAYLFSLPDSDSKGQVWLPQLQSTKLIGQLSDPKAAHPEIHLAEVEYKNGNWNEKTPTWEWRRSLLGTASSQRYDQHFTLEDGVWQRVVGYQRNGQDIVHVDYAAGTGTTIRFGDGEFGKIPAEKTVFEVTYRLGNGKRGNLPADSITKFDNATLNFIESVTNPFPITNGVDPESPEAIKQLAPEAFRAITYRAVRPEDYAEAAERLPWVQRAGTTFRWTGSWLSAFTTADPKGTVTISNAQRTELLEQLDRFRQAGREVHVLDPQYADLDLIVTICVAPDAYPGQTKAAVLEALFGKIGVNPRPGFFSPDNFTFGTSLRRSVLEATIQSVPGVRAVEKITIARRGWFEQREMTELVFSVGMNEVIRVENDPRHPERGSLQLLMEGGA